MTKNQTERVIKSLVLTTEGWKKMIIDDDVSLCLHRAISEVFVSLWENVGLSNQICKGFYAKLIIMKFFILLCLRASECVR